MKSAKMFGAALGFISLGALAMACGASGGSTTGFIEDAGGGDLDADTFVTDSGSGAVDSGKITKPADAGFDSGLVIDAGPTGNPVGFPCAAPTDCESRLCAPVIAGAGPVCVSTCTTQSDCTDNFFCDPFAPGSDAGTGGYCVPHSPSHCAICTDNSDCGSLSEVCGIAAGDTAKACHIDCSLAPTAGTNSACPSDYTCEATTIDGVARQLCMPKSPITNCVDAVGGFCDRISTPQTCDRTNSAGICVGSRTCDASDNRYTSCDAAAPACRNCTMTNPVGCTENLCSNAAIDTSNCGSCNNVCPGLGKANDNVTCDTTGSSPACTFSCQGENYDVNNSTSDGCEIADSPTGNHVSTTPASGGSLPCSDGSSNPNLHGEIVSDKRVHTDPTVAGFDATTGSAPDFFSIDATGGDFCEDDISILFTVTGSSNAACYTVIVTSNKNSDSCTPSAATGSCSFSHGSGWYSDGTNITFEVEKTCSSSVDEVATYAITGHL
jgi:hypothetical protein